jgi:protocatechuate 3,4-dioxygenase alpha subunit
MTDRPPRLEPTASQTVGPFFHFALADQTAVGEMAVPEVPGERLTLRVSVFDGAGEPMPDALIELYQADADGCYPARDSVAPVFAGFGRLPTDADGRCVFRTIKPGRVPDGRGGLQAAHVNVCVLGRGLLQHLFTRMYFAADPALDEDAIFNEVAPARRPTLLAVATADTPGAWNFDIRLQGARETVFFE